ncbi:hypothetical protein EBU95_05435 [bacterium]|nr:hypothetical protein [bacterium]
MKQKMLIGLVAVFVLVTLLFRPQKCVRESLDTVKSTEASFNSTPTSTLERKIVAHFQQYGNPSYASYIELLNNNNNVSTNLVRMSTFQYFTKLGKDLTLENVINLV